MTISLLSRIPSPPQNPGSQTSSQSPPRESDIDFLRDSECEIVNEDFAARDFTRYLSAGEKYAINSQGVKTEEIDAFVQKLQTKTGVVALLENIDCYERSPLLGLFGAYVKKALSISQVASLCLWRAAIQQYVTDPCVNLIFEGPEIYSIQTQKVSLPTQFHPVHAQLIDDCNEFVEKMFNLSKEETSQLLKQLEGKPLSERYYLTIEQPLGDMLISAGHHQLIHVLDRLKPVAIGVSKINHLITRKVMVIPSFSICAEVSKVRYRQDAIPLVPILGNGNEEMETEHNLRDQRMFRVGMREVPIDAIVNNIYWGPYIRSMWDWYYGERGGMIGNKGRRIVRDIYERILENPVTSNTKAFKKKLIQGELWRGPENFGAFFGCPALPWAKKNDLHRQAIIKDLALFPNYWKEEHGVTAAILKASEKTLHDEIISSITPSQRTEAEKALFVFCQQKAKNSRDPLLHFKLGNFYYTGFGTKKSVVEAIKWWNKSNIPHALHNIYIAYEKAQDKPITFPEVLSYLNKAAETYSPAQVHLGYIHWLGRHRQPINYTAAYTAFTKAAQQEHPEALYNLAMMHEKGEGVEKDLPKYYAFIKRAAAAGHADAQYTIGLCYYNGQPTEFGFSKDRARAWDYFSSAAQQGSKGAQEAIQGMLKVGWNIATKSY